MNLGASLDGIATALRLRRHGIARHMRVFSHSTPAERLALFQTARQLPPRACVLEIGSYLGSSALFICAGLAPGGGHLFCVDTWMNHTMPETRDTYGEFKTNIRPYSHMITPIRKFSNELTEADIGRPLDFVFIDGDHSEIAARRDFRLIAPWVKADGLVAFHDVHSGAPGVQVVVGEAVASGAWQLVRLVEGLGILKRVSA
jgi:predicted O-methyltransferase YrrM